MILDKMLSKLTDNYKKTPISNIGKLFNVIFIELEDLKTLFNKIEEYRDIDKAIGYTLDKIGSNENKKREGLEDELYKVLLKVVSKKDLSDTNINSILESCAAITRQNVEDVYLEERFPAGIYIRMPLAELGDAVYKDPALVGVFMQSIIGGGISLEILYEGSFGFSSINDPLFDPSVVQKSDSGFASEDFQEGGSLGSYFDSTKGGV